MTQELKNENITVMVETKPHCQVQLNVTVSPKASKEAHKKAIKAVNKEVSLPGFRKGKAPEPMIMKHYEGYVTDEWKQNLVQVAFSEAIKLAKVYPLNDHSVKKPSLKSFSQDEDSQVLIEFEAYPEIPSVEPSFANLQPSEPKPVTEEAVKEFLDELRWHFAEWSEITDRPAREDDSVQLDIENLDKPGHFICQDTTFNVIKGKMGDWMHQRIIGLNVNDSFEATSERSPQEETDADFTPTRCKVTIKAIKKATLPEIDDKLATSMGGENVADLEMKARQNLERQAADSVQENARKQIEKALLEKYSFELPASILQAEVKNRTAIRHQELKKTGMTEEQIKETLQNEKESIKNESTDTIRTFFLVRKIAEEQKIEVSQNEIFQSLMQELYRAKPASSDKDMEEARTRVYLRKLNEKVMDFLIDHSKKLAI